jgi:hypothetical protein
MKKLIAIGLVVVSTSAWAEWTEVFTTVSGVVFYVDLSTLKTGQRPRIWIFSRYPKVSSKTGVGSARQLVEGDCAEGRIRGLYLTLFSDRDGDKVDDVIAEPEKWSYPAPQTVEYTLFKIMCGKAP